MKLPLALTALLLMASCQGAPGAAFDTQNVGSRSAAPAGASTTAVTILGRVNAPADYGKLTVAALTDSSLYDGIDSTLNEGTLASAPVTDGKLSLAIPAKADLNDPDDPAKPISYRYIERWQLVVFKDVNGNGKYDVNLPLKRRQETDRALPLRQKYRLGYKSYKDGSKYAFLPMNDMKQGWILMERSPGFLNGYHQDFSRVFDFTVPDSLGHVNQLSTGNGNAQATPTP